MSYMLMCNTMLSFVGFSAHRTLSVNYSRSPFFYV